jgi:hypothetical protein
MTKMNCCGCYFFERPKKCATAANRKLLLIAPATLPGRQNLRFTPPADLHALSHSKKAIMENNGLNR